MVKNPPARRRRFNLCIGKTHSSILAWENPRTEESGGLQSMGSQRIGHDFSMHRQVCYKIDINITHPPSFYRKPSLGEIQKLANWSSMQTQLGHQGKLSAS